VSGFWVWLQSGVAGSYHVTDAQADALRAAGYPVDDWRAHESPSPHSAE
jgi:hypothetical protein